MPELGATDAAIRDAVSYLTAHRFDVVDSLPAVDARGAAVQLRPENDPIAEVVSFYEDHISFDGSVAVFSSIDVVFGALPHFAELVRTPTVFHAEVGDDYGPVSALRHSRFVMLQSLGVVDGREVAIAAHYIARKLSAPVIHFFRNLDGPASSSLDLAQINELFVKGINMSQDEQVVPAPQDVASVVRDALCAVRLDRAFVYSGPPDAKAALLVLGDIQPLAEVAARHKVGVVTVRIYSPNCFDVLADTLPASVNKIAVLEQTSRVNTSWLPLLQDLLCAPSELLSRFKSITSYQLGYLDSCAAETALEQIMTEFDAKEVEHGKFIGAEFSTGQRLSPEQEARRAAARRHEEPYTNVLRQLFPHLEILNDPALEKLATNAPEYGLGRFLAKDAAQRTMVNEISEKVADGIYSDEVSSLLTEWITVGSSDRFYDRLTQAVPRDPAASEIDLEKFRPHQFWLIGSDAWAYDLGNSGVHHALTLNRNVNVLVIDTAPESATSSSGRRKKDIGLYAMGFGNAYVASVAVYASYTQLLQAMLEAAKFDGPSVITAYLPYGTDPQHVDALAILQETKRAVDSGYWPLYRYNPLKPDDEAFTLDSYTLRKSLKSFLDREQLLSLLSRKTPKFSKYIAGSYGNNIQVHQARRAKEAYKRLLDGLSGPPLLILFASDGGQAESVAKRLALRAKARTVKARVLAMDDVEVEALVAEQHVVFVTSTAGQGEFPQNGRAFWDQLKSAADLDLSEVKVGVFGMGDSKYWPRKADRIYFNKPSKDLHARLQKLGAQELLPLGQGDDQAEDGWSTAYNEWEPALWDALGVDRTAGVNEPVPPTNEDIKIGSNYLRGTIAAALKDTSTGAVSANDQQLTKFHGIYMQDDRDLRDERKARGIEPAYSFMVRVRLPGCVATPEQWLKIDELSDSRGNGTFKLTTRGTFQLHGVIKQDLKAAIRGINSVLLDTVAACGDVDRNVVGTSLPNNQKVHKQIVDTAHAISEHLLPKTTAYYEIWLEGSDESDKPGDEDVWNNRSAGPTKKTKKQLVGQSPIEDIEPMYGPAYLPRKFKVNIAVPPLNDVDVYAHDVGLIAIVEKDIVVGYNVLCGGGMGTTHNNTKTYPRLGSPLGFVPQDKIKEVVENIMLVQRDYGNRANRKHARLKYTIDDMGVDEFKHKVEEYLGYKLEPPRQHIPFTTNADPFGWIRDEDNMNHFTCFIENGRVEDTSELHFRTGLRKIAEFLVGSKGEFRLTANQHVVLSNITDCQLPRVKELLDEFKLDNLNFTGLRLSSQACVAFPTCGLAMAESERYLPVFLTKLEAAIEEYGLRHDSIVLRMTGCPNGCSRPWVAEIALIGKAYGTYNLMLGGGHHGERLNKLYRSSLKEDEILEILRPMLKQWALEREENEHFGDFVIRKKIISATREGKDFWDKIEPGLE